MCKNVQHAIKLQKRYNLVPVVRKVLPHIFIKLLYSLGRNRKGYLGQRNQEKIIRKNTSIVVKLSRYYSYNHNLTGGSAVRSITLCGTGSSTGWFMEFKLFQKYFHFLGYLLQKLTTCNVKIEIYSAFKYMQFNSSIIQV